MWPLCGVCRRNSRKADAAGAVAGEFRARKSR